MQTTVPVSAPKTSSLFHSPRIFPLPSADKAKAFASVQVANAVMITGMKIMDGKFGLFVSMPSRKNAKGEYNDVAFPISKEMREELSRVVLEEFERVSQANPAIAA